ncbi:zinc finger, CCHC-type containing protein [Tanacetum coccineum]
MADAAMSVVYVLTTLIPKDGGDDPTAEDEALDKFKVFKTGVKFQQRSLLKRFRTDTGGEYMDTLYFQAVVRLPDPKLKTLCERGTECIFVGYVEHSKDFRFYVIEPNDSVSINSIIESRDAIFDENRFSSVLRSSQRSLVKGTKDSGGSVVHEKVIEEVVQQPESKLRKSKRHRTPKDFGPEFQLYLIEGTKDDVSDQHSYCFNVEDDPKTFDEAMKSKDVAFWKEAINDEMDSIIGNNTWVLTDLPPVNTPMDTCEKLMLNNGQAVSQLEYSRVIGCLMYAMTCTRPDIAFAVGKLSRYTSNPGTQHWEAIQRSDPAQGKTNGKTTDDKLMIDSTTRPVSYVSALKPETRTKKVNFYELQPQESVEDADLKIPKALIEEVSGRVGNTLYGYFIGKRLAFPIVENYIWNAWSKFGIQKVMMNTKGFFFFKFATKKGLEDVLKAGPWMIQNTPIILMAWTPRTTLMIEDLTKVPVWFKLHDVPMVAYTANGLILIATKIGTPKMLDSYTCTMCEESWGRNVELNSEKELVNNLVVAIPLLEEQGYTKETIRVEYEWFPRRCTACKTFGHMTDQCPKNTVEKTIVNVADDGFRQVGNRRGKNIVGNQNGVPRPIGGVILNKAKSKYFYHPKANAKKVDEANASHKVNTNEASTSKAGTKKKQSVVLTNSFGVLSGGEYDDDI